MRIKLFRRGHRRGETRSGLLLDESGQTIVVAALCMVMLIGFLGLAIDVGHLRYAKRNLQSAADAAALAAGAEIRVCGGITGSCAYMLTAAQKALEENGFTVLNTITGCKATIPVTGLTLQINYGPCGASDPNNGNAGYVEAIVSQPQQMWFAWILGINNVPVSARAEAMRNPTAPCIYALDPSAQGAITLLVGLGVQGNCGMVDESNNKLALVCGVGLGISVPQIAIHGAAGGLLCGATPPPLTNMPLPVPADPLAYLQAPLTANASCGTSRSSPYTGSSSPVVSGLLLSTIVFNPGVYCGGINIGLGVAANVTFRPGVYILRDVGVIPAGGLSINVGVGTTIVGNGVTFYNEGPSAPLNIALPSVGGTFNLSAPTTGNYAGILFFQPANITTPGSFLVTLAANQSMNGAIYAPGASISYGVNVLSAPSSYNILVAKDISFLAGVLTSFGNNYSSLPAGSPLNGDDAVLVQ